MASSTRHDPVRELALLVRAPEPGSNNLGEFIAANASGLAQELGVSVPRLEAERIVDDEELAPRIRHLLERARNHYIEEDLRRRRERSLAAAQRLGSTARWTDVGAELDVDVLLGELLADRAKKWIGFVEPGGFTTVISRHLIAAAAPLRRIHMDLAASVNTVELGFRWRGGRGGYNWFPRTVDPQFADRGLIVPLAPRQVKVPQRERAGAWLGQILKEMGYAV
jgi:hypothetical protein